jgi:uncharacterized protein (DUF433 family)
MANIVFRTEKSWIQKRPNVCGGKPCIRDSRISVHGIIEYLQLGVSKEELPERIIGLTPADIEAAEAYYAANRDEIDEIIRADAEA